jgi:phospho-N-acetylmuramoyl-pentapeptide-transferase
MLAVYYLEAAKILTYTALAFFVAMWWAPYLIRLLNWLKFWKKGYKTVATTGEELVVTKQFYKENDHKPRAGGVLVWVTTIGLALFFWIILKIESTPLTQFLNFIDRRETFIPLGTLFFGSILGLIDDALATMEGAGNYAAGGLKLSQRLLVVAGFSMLISLWFYYKVDISSFSLFNWNIDLDSFTLPFGINGGWLIIPITLIILIGTWSTGIIDGFDGLFAGVVIPVMLCFAGLAFSRQMYDIATMMMVMAGSTTAFLWFNIPPAKFFMGDTGTVGILLTIAVVAILTDYIYILPIAGLMLFVSSSSAIIQIFSKKVFKKKVFLAAPFHHHLEAIGWTKTQVTMRYWLISIMMSTLGLAIGLLFR